MTTSVDLANRALAEIGTRSRLTGPAIDPNESAEALYASLLYAPLRDFLLAEGDYFFSLFIGSAIASTPIIPPWTHTYNYPAGALRIRQLYPVGVNLLDPRPVEWTSVAIGTDKKIFTNQVIDNILFTAAPINEDIWEPIFTEAFVRLLASALTFALENRVEASSVKLQEAISFAGIANLRDE